MSTAHRLSYDLGKIGGGIDPGTGGKFQVKGRSLVRFDMVSAAASETRTLPLPSSAGQIVTLIHGVDGGDIDITVTSGFDSSGNTAMNTTTAGDFVTFFSTMTAANTFRWRVWGFEGVTGISDVVGFLDLNGLADGLILDANGNTTVSSPTANQIDWEIGGADDFTMTANNFNVIAASEVSGAQGATMLTFTPTGAQQTLGVGGGAVTITQFYTDVAVDAGGDALTLANSTTIGHLKKIQMTATAGGTGVLTPSTLAGGTTITFADIGDFALLLWASSSGWVPIELGNDADGATAPALA